MNDRGEICLWMTQSNKPVPAGAAKTQSQGQKSNGESHEGKKMNQNDTIEENLKGKKAGIFVMSL